MPAVPSPRYADAVRARRAELRAARSELTGGHRCELGHELALARLAAAAELAEEATHLGGQARAYVEAAGRADRLRFPAVLTAAVADLRRTLAARRVAAVQAAARRVAGRRGLRLDALPAGHPPVPPTLPPPDPPVPRWTGILGGWRTVLLPAAALPLVGLPMTGTPAVLAATGLGVVAAAAVGGHCIAAADRARLHRWCSEALGAVRADGATALARLVVEVEQAAMAELDVAAERRLAGLDAELAALAPAVSGG